MTAKISQSELLEAELLSSAVFEDESESVVDQCLSAAEEEFREYGGALDGLVVRRDLLKGSGTLISKLRRLAGLQEEESIFDGGIEVCVRPERRIPPPPFTGEIEDDLTEGRFG